MLGFISISTVFADNTVTTSNTNISTTTDYSYTGEIVPYKTSYGNGGYTKIELYGGGREVWWSVKPNTSKGYTYSGLITITSQITLLEYILSANLAKEVNQLVVHSVYLKSKKCRYKRNCIWCRRSTNLYPNYRLKYILTPKSWTCYFIKD